MSELKWNLEKNIGNHFYLVLITVSMNLFDRLVIVACDPVMKS